MTADHFLTNFGHVAMAPSGVKRLRELVLHLAVSGRLAPRQSGEGSADVSIAEAATLKDAYRAKHELRPSGSDRPLAESELEFEIPAYWKWERLGNIACYIQRGKGPKYDEAGKTRVVSQKSVQWTGFDLSSARRISDESVKDYSHERFLVGGDILWNSTGTGTAGRLVLYPGAKEQVVADSHVTVIRLTNFVPAYVWCYLVSPTIQQRMIPGQENSMVTGTTNQVELSAAKVSELPIPCPPLAEQKRIVAKVDELMALCDQLEAQQQERERRFPVLSRTCHARFAEAPTPANLNRIFDETGAVSPDDLRKTILNLAIRGRLDGRSNEEPADELLFEMQKRREKLILAKKIRRPKPLPPVSGDEIPFAVPDSWRWSRWGQICDWITYGFTRPMSHVKDGPPIVTAKNVRDGFMTFENSHRAAPAEFAELNPKDLPRMGDILITKDGTIGRAALVNSNEPFCINQSVAVLWLESCLLYAPFLLIVIRSPFAQERIWAAAEGMAIKHLAITDFGRMILPIPPLAEQRRIVAKVDELMALVDQLEAQQQERDKLAEAFAKACVASFTGTTQLERPKKMKAPKTELVSLITVAKKLKAGTKAPLAQLLIQAKGTLPAKSLWQQSGLTIDAFYQQLKTELAQGWIAPPVEAEMKILEEA